MRTLTPLEPPKLNPRGDIYETEIRKAFFAKALPLTWQTWTPCPCGALATLPVPGAPLQLKTREKRADCPGCKGTGLNYSAGQPIRGIVQRAVKSPDRFSPAGILGAGYVSITILPEDSPGYLDRYTMTGSGMVFHDVRTRKATVDELRYPVFVRPVVTGTAPPGSAKTPVTQTFGVLRCVRADLNGVFISGELAEGTDFDVVSGNIDWTKGIANGKAPVVGARYGISYYANPVYLIKSLPHPVRDTMIAKKAPAPYQISLPVSVDCWLEWLGD